MAHFTAYKPFDYAKLSLPAPPIPYGFSSTTMNYRTPDNSFVVKIKGTGFIDENNTGDFDFGLIQETSLFVNGSLVFEATGIDKRVENDVSEYGYTVDGHLLTALQAEQGFWLRNNDQVTGSSGADRLAGFAGSDNMEGKAGNDTLEGWSGNDVLNGGAGADVMLGGAGNDIYYVDNSNDKVYETTSTSNAGGTDKVNSSVSFNLSSYKGVSFVEHLTLTGTAAINATGNALANTLTGNSAANTLRGESGNDTLIGGAGKDIMVGGLGSDVFDFNALTEMGTTSTTCDVISDFVRGQDKIDLSTLDANTATAANDAFKATLIGSTASFTAAGQLKLVSGVLYGNTDADGTAEFAIQLTGITTLNASDLIL